MSLATLNFQPYSHFVRNWYSHEYFVRLSLIISYVEGNTWERLQKEQATLRYYGKEGLRLCEKKKRKENIHHVDNILVLWTARNSTFANIQGKTSLRGVYDKRRLYTAFYYQVFISPRYEYRLIYCCLVPRICLMNSCIFIHCNGPFVY